MATLAEQLGTFAAGLSIEHVPPAAIEKARTCVLNSYGMALGGQRLPYAAVARAAALAAHGTSPNGATLLGDGRMTSIPGACIANATLFHARAQDDTCGAAHFGTVLVPMLTAMIEARGYPVDRFLPSLIAGYEVGGAIEQLYGSATTAIGFRSTALYGTVAAAAAAARLMSFDAPTTTAAIAIATALLGGNLHSATAGTDEWHYQPGFAATNGLMAAELAGAGCPASPHAFEGDNGFASFHRLPATGTPTLSLGTSWQIMRATFKPFPVCAFNQTPVTAALRARDVIDVATIESLCVQMNPNEANYPGLNSQEFTSVAATLLSLPFCVAATLLYGIPDIGRLTIFDDPVLNALAARIGIVSDADVPPLSVVLDFALTDGTRRTIDVPMRARDYGYDRTTVATLIRRIGGEEGVPMSAYDRLESFVERLPNVTWTEIRDVFAACSVVRKNARA